MNVGTVYARNFSSEEIAMKKLNWDLLQMTKRNRDGSFATQADRWHTLDLIARQLYALGYKNLRAESLKPRHVEDLVKQWLSEGLSTGTIKNRISYLRWWAEKIGNPSIVSSNNKVLGVPDRRYVTNENKAQTLDRTRLEMVTNPRVRLCLELQEAFGLRREEAIKFQPGFSDRDTALVLKDSTTKGGRGRTIPIRTEAQRELVDRAHALAGEGSLIPANLKYVQQMGIYERATKKAGLHNMHGLRHGYAQRLYQELTGWPAPAAGGPRQCELTPEQRELDRQARLQVSEELGHGRMQIAANYLGS
jgi:integrase